VLGVSQVITMSKIEKTQPQHNQQRGIRWFAAEFLVVVTGILVALTVNAWWSDRAERAQERELLRGLHAEFVANKALFDRTTDLHRQSIVQARQLLKLTGPDPTDIDPTEIDVLLFPLLSEIPSFHPAMGEMEAMLGSGQLALIRDDRLRTAIAAWPGALSLLRETEDEMREDVIRVFYPYVVERMPLVTMDYRVGFIDTPGPSRFPRDYKTLLADVVFENHVENRWVMARFILKDGERVRQLLDDVIRMIDAQLGEAASTSGTGNTPDPE
jgi:hypothetical protein